eukprot:m.203607 g.203607  ORF g.203607 m.203607 type:complete len:510 (+) comp39627_c1_seq2:38-1567(+)
MNTEGSRSDLERRRNERQREKELALVYLKEKQGQIECERILNDACQSKPDDFYGFLTKSFGKLAKDPIISAVRGLECLSVGGKVAAIQIKVSCVLHGIEQVIGSSVCPPSLPSLPTSVAERSPSSISKRSKSRQSRPSSQLSVDLPITPQITPAADVIPKLAPTLIGKPLKDIHQLDNVLGRPEIAETGNQRAIMAVSLALARSISQLAKQPLLSILNKERDVSGPTVMAKVLSGGRYANGKLKVRQFYVMPSEEMEYTEGLKCIMQFHENLGTVLSSKYGASSKATLPDGSYAPSLDKMEQALDFIQEAVNGAQLELGTHLVIGINIDAESCYDPDKNKYELTSGQWKSSDDVVNYYADLVAQRSYIHLLEDPLAKSDIGGWKKLRERLNDKCTLLTSYNLDPIPVETEEEIQEVGFSCDWDNFRTLSQLSDNLKTRPQQQKVALGFSELEDIDCLVDLAIAFGTAFIKLPGPANSSLVALYQRAAEIGRRQATSHVIVEDTAKTMNE